MTYLVRWCGLSSAGGRERASRDVLLVAGARGAAEWLTSAPVMEPAAEISITFLSLPAAAIPLQPIFHSRRLRARCLSNQISRSTRRVSLRRKICP